jgi:capsular polysaccharide transport system ATP-binding protein
LAEDDLDVIRLNGITKYYPTLQGRRYVLRDVTLELPSGVNIGVIGRNGAGKSTLMRLLGRIDYPNRGRVETDLKVSWPMGLAGGMQGTLTGRDNASFVCRVYGASTQDVRRKIAFIHEFSELEEYFDMPVKSYSSGMRARLTFAMSMAFEFDFYLIDELTAVGDQRFRQKSKEALDERKTRANYIMASHNMQELLRGCEAGMFIHDGQLHFHESLADAVAAYDEYRKAN